MSQILRAARYLAARNPDLVLACPCCAALVGAAGLDRHLGHVHPGAGTSDAPSWRGSGLFAARLGVEGRGELHLTRMGGLRQRRIPLVEKVTIGPVVGRRPDPTLVSYVDDTAAPARGRRVGVYLRIDGNGQSITVRSSSIGQVRKLWTGWYEGRARRAADISLSPADFVALQYLLHEIGPLRLRPDRGSRRS